VHHLERGVTRVEKWHGLACGLEHRRTCNVEGVAGLLFGHQGDHSHRRQVDDRAKVAVDAGALPVQSLGLAGRVRR
jgi:hypothetical protein